MSLAIGAAGVHLGPRALALAADLNKAKGLSMRKTCAVLRDCFGLQLQANRPARQVGRKDLNVLSRRSSSDLASINSFLRSSSAFSPVGLRTGSQLFFLR